MAREVVERFTDDLDGSEATHHGVQFSFEGTDWSIDLSDENYEKLRLAIERFADHATRMSGSGRGRGRSASTSSSGSARGKKEELQAVRAWAEKNGIVLNSRGRIAESILAAYRDNDPFLVKGAS
ncbi:histone-like nucleoid-structuring protein Lsr2 [Arthrobacter sp. SO3]|uniref:histone-like nucleoid-structuring protein Lsr2 n=1 Tax=Arthrobacter sp. SO3 TaxID=1897057 RepID=UPI001CFFE5DE|nr:Lsr2 family protein [Arthrobacter sp. SO3]MCB5291641.1 Nucleoid-associated protein Lsr2 [Arthrobacter sp. SO3]